MLQSWDISQVFYKDIALILTNLILICKIYRTPLADHLLRVRQSFAV